MSKESWRILRVVTIRQGHAEEGWRQTRTFSEHEVEEEHVEVVVRGHILPELVQYGRATVYPILTHRGKVRDVEKAASREGRTSSR